MQLSSRTLEELRVIINGDGTPEYRSGPKLVSFFNALGFNDTYGQGFPSRWVYTDDRLQRINGTPELDKCIRQTFAVVNYIGRITELDALILRFNQYLAFDKWKVIRNNDEISFAKLDKVIIDSDEKDSTEIDEMQFLKTAFAVNLDLLGLDTNIKDIIRSRLDEAESCVKNDAPLASIFLIGSILEGVLLGVASSYPALFNKASCAPKDANSGKVRKFPEWTLNNFIDVASEIGILKQDVKKFSHALRDFRNYIHPYSQMVTNFYPDKHTALICLQVLKAAIFQICEYKQMGGK